MNEEIKQEDVWKRLEQHKLPEEKLSNWEILNWATLAIIGLLLAFIVINGGVVKERVVIVDLSQGGYFVHKSIDMANQHLRELGKANLNAEKIDQIIEEDVMVVKAIENLEDNF